MGKPAPEGWVKRGLPLESHSLNYTELQHLGKFFRCKRADLEEQLYAGSGPALRRLLITGGEGVSIFSLYLI